MRITENVHLLESTRGAFVYLVDAAEKTLVDTGLPWQGNAIAKELHTMGVRPQEIKHILLTHYDVDHIGNAARLQGLTGATLWACETEIPYILGDVPKPGFKKHISKIFRCKKPNQIAAMQGALCGGEIKAIPTPGHTPGHTCLLYGDVLFAGDIVENHKGALRPYPKGWNWNNALMLESIKKLNELPFRWVCTAHGRPLERDTWDGMMGELPLRI